MVELLDLPNEILIEILRELLVNHGHEFILKNEVHMTSLRLVNRSLSELVDKVWRKGLRIRGYSNEGFPRKFPEFAAYVAQNPTRRKCITSIQLELDTDDFMLIRHDNYVLLDHLKNAAPRYWDGELSKEWQPGKVFRAYPHAIALLSILPHVEKMLICVQLPGPQSSFNSTQIVEFKTPLASLREIVFHGPYDGFMGPKHEVHIPLRSLPALSELSGLRRLRLYGIDIASYFKYETPFARLEEGDDPMTHFENLSLPIEEICIANSVVKNIHIQYLIRACRRLTHFHFEESSDEKKRIAMETVDVQGWHQALLLHMDSLVALSLCCMGQWRIKRYETGCKPLPTWPSLAAFNKLKILKIEYRRIEYESLPRTLQILYLVDCRQIKNSDEIEGWKRLKSDYCPEIIRLAIDVTHNGYSIHRQVKYSGFYKTYEWDKTRVYDQRGFDIEVSFRGPSYPYDDFSDWEFPEGSESSSEDSYGDKVDYSDDEDWMPEEHGRQESICAEEYEEGDECDDEERSQKEEWDEEQEIEAYLQYKESEDAEAAVETSEGRFTDVATDEDDGYEAESSDTGEESGEEGEEPEL